LLAGGQSAKILVESLIISLYKINIGLALFEYSHGPCDSLELSVAPFVPLPSRPLVFPTLPKNEPSGGNLVEDMSEIVKIESGFVVD
jgi:hypothetical protein